MITKNRQYNSVDDFRLEAEKKLDAKVREFYFNGAGCQNTLKENEAAFSRIKLRNKVLVDVSKRSTNTSIFNQNFSAPFYVAPMAFHKLASDEAELGSAKAANKAGAGMIMSALSTSRFEDIAAVSENKPWLQIYLYKKREIVEKIVALAEKSDYHALVLTVDTPVYDRRYTRHGRFCLPRDFTLENLRSCGLDIEKVSLNKRADYLTTQLDDS